LGNNGQTRRAPRRQIRRVLRLLLRLISLLGFDPPRLATNVREFPRFVWDAVLYTRKRPAQAFRVRLLDLNPIVNERNEPAGTVGGSYFHQDLWAARKIFERRPEAHIDIGSRLDGFIAHLLTFMPVTVIDIRAIQSRIPGLSFIQDDATELANIPDNSVDSLSSLHAAEHFGLGRYSDAVDPDACFRFMRSLERVLAPGGRLYFSVPMGRERVEFNAHRIFAFQTVVKAFPNLSIVSFSAVDDAGDLHENADPPVVSDFEYGCGLFEFTKPLPTHEE